MIHIGEIIHRYFEDKRIRRAALARLMAIQLKSLMIYEKKESIQTSRLLELCTHLQHNFFMDIATQLPPNYTTATDVFAQKKDTIASLEKEIEKLKIENDLLKKICKVS